MAGPGGGGAQTAPTKRTVVDRWPEPCRPRIRPTSRGAGHGRRIDFRAGAHGYQEVPAPEQYRAPVRATCDAGMVQV